MRHCLTLLIIGILAFASPPRLSACNDFFLDLPLHWYVDADAAAKEARERGVPILHLRLLGRFDETLSCANSRFFRTLLYPDPAIAAMLRERFVLCWSSERPVPKLTIDFGDGRVVDTTITGNSAHYVLDAEGRVLDALPGLVAPKHFLAWLHRVDDLHQQLAVAADRSTALAAWHRERSDLLARERAAAMQAQGIEAERLIAVEEAIGDPALDAGHLARAKRRIELPVLHAVMRARRVTEDAEVWTPLAEALGVDTTLDPRVTGEVIMQVTGTDQNPAEVLEQLHADLALDTARNAWRLHATIHAWLAAEPALDFASLNRRIYADLFLTPASDPWLGLDPHQAFSGLPAGGLRPTAAADKPAEAAAEAMARRELLR